MRIEKSCPVPQTHNRLRRFHDLWHELAVAYPDGEAFLDKLNDCIQAARNVTFVLQSEADKHDWFDDWYAKQQERMKADQLMAWLRDARTTVVHKGDLEAHSLAKVSLVVTDAQFDLAEVEVPPFVSPQEAAAAIRVDKIPERIRGQAVLAVERRWTVRELSDGELLDSLGHCYGVLAGVVLGAHEQCGVEMQTFGGETHGKRHHREPHPSGRLPCMLPTREARTAYWHLGADSLAEQDVEPLAVPTTEDERKEWREQAGRRYGDLSRHRIMPGTPMPEQTAAMHQIGRRILEADGYHRMFAWLYREAVPVGQYEITPDDQQDKILKTRRLAAEVERTAADAVMVVGETWWAREVPPDNPQADLRPANRDDRQEALLTVLLQRSGDNRRWTTPYGRDNDDRVVLDEAHEDEFGFMPLYGPIFDVWKSWDSKEPTSAST